jgi:hypothetical protein
MKMKKKIYEKKWMKGIIAGALSVAILSASVNISYAKTYYCTKYNDIVSGNPWEIPLSEDEREGGLFVELNDSATKSYDYDGDGEKEEVYLSFKQNKTTGEVSYKWTINGQKVDFDLKMLFVDADLNFWDEVVDGEHYAVFCNAPLPGKEEYYFFRWNSDDTLTFCKKITANHVFSAYEKSTGDRYLYVKNTSFITKKSKWPKKFKKIKKFKKKKNAVVVKIVYKKYTSSNHSLKYAGKDVCYRICDSDFKDVYK